MGRYHFAGLSNTEVITSRSIHGTNALDTPKVETFCEKLLDNFRDPLIKILCIALTITIVLAFFGYSSWLEGIGIAVAVFLATVVSTYSEFKNESSFQELQKRASLQLCRVYRNGGCLLEVSIKDLVVGDYILLQAGDKVPADGKLVAGELFVNNAVLNGEYQSKRKTVPPPHYVPPDEYDFSDPHLLFRGSIVDDGEAVMIAEAVGKNTVYGKFATELTMTVDDRASPLQFKLSVLADQISKLGYVMALCIAISFLFKQIVLDNHSNWSEILGYLRNVPGLLHDLVTSVILAIIIIVVAVPEGLPMMIAIVLSLNMRRLLKAKILVRKLLGIETAGSMSILFADKTGTMTKGRFEPHSFISGYLQTYTSFTDVPPRLAFLLGFVLRVSTSAVINRNTAEIIGGNASDKALLLFLDKKTLCENVVDVVVEKQILFNSERKFSATQILVPKQFCKQFSMTDLDEQQQQRIVIVKGATELLLSKCKFFYDQNGVPMPLDTNLMVLQQEVDSASLTGQRMIAVATCRQLLSEENETEVPNNLELIGIIGVLDQLRSTTKDAITDLKRAGVQTVMITGDKKETAVAVAIEAGLLDSGYVVQSPHTVITSQELKTLTDEQLTTLLPRLRIVARALPTDKSRLVTVAQKMGYVVGMTGDGINDSAALRRADVGFVMGSGADIAKEVADIVILDDNFSAVTKAVLYGRTIFKSIRKFIVFQSTINLASTCIVFLGPFLGYDFPLTLIQLLWVNLVMDTLAALAFGGEPPLDTYMEEKPIKREANIINTYMWSSIIANGLYIALLSILFLTSNTIKRMFVRNGMMNEDAFLTGFFCFFIFISNFNAFNVRTPSTNLTAHLLENRNFLAVETFIFCVQVIMTYIGGKWLRTVGLLLSEWITVIVLSVTIIPYDVLRKLFVVPRLKRKRSRSSSRSDIERYDETMHDFV
jgi:Ca2+-transporting ATPase